MFLEHFESIQISRISKKAPGKSNVLNIVQFNSEYIINEAHSLKKTVSDTCTTCIWVFKSIYNPHVVIVTTIQQCWPHCRLRHVRKNSSSSYQNFPYSFYSIRFIVMYFIYFTLLCSDSLRTQKKQHRCCYLFTFISMEKYNSF